MLKNLTLGLRAWCLMLALTLSSLLTGNALAADDFLEPEQAFKVSVRALDAQHVQVSYAIAPAYYMYGEQFKIEVRGAALGEYTRPKGKIKFDETFQKEVETFREQWTVQVPVNAVQGPFLLSVTGQGCSDKGLCYPPLTNVAQVTLGADRAEVRLLEAEAGSKAWAAGVNGTVEAGVGSAPAAVKAAGDSEGSSLDRALQSGHFWTVIGVFFLAGVLLSLTPCVLPMLPILSSIIVGSKGSKTSRSRSFLLALSYSLGMALVYTALGVAAGLAGEGLAAALQKPWVLGLFAAGLVAFSLSMFGVYELQLPQSLTGGLSQASQRLPAGQFAGVFVMGGVSALIVSPCVAAPLAGALVFISQSRDYMLGGTALFALASGMSVPLLLLGASAGTLLPRSGAWMDGVKHFFGLLLLGVALWTVQPVLPASLSLALWGILLIGGAIVFGLFEAPHAAHAPRTWLRKTLAAVAAVFGVLQLIGAASGGRDALQPLTHWVSAAGATGVSKGQEGVQFQLVRSVAELDAALARAGRPVMLDFYADWCVSCKEMERFTFSDPAVRQRLQGALLLKADVTQNNADDKALLRRFNLFGPPGIIFFDAQGKELDGVRVIGFQNAERFTQSLQAAGL